MAAALLAALVLRLPFLGPRFGPDDDEIYTLRFAEELFTRPAPPVAGWPLLFLAVRAALEATAWLEFSLRWFPLASGLAAVVLAARTGASLFGRSAGGFAAWLVALWPWHLYYSGLGRYYAPVFLFSLWFLDRWSAWRRDGEPAWAARSAAAIAAAAAVHPTGLLAATATVADLPALLRRLGRRAWVLLAAGVSLVAAAACALWWEAVSGVVRGATGHGYDAVRFFFGLAFNVHPLVGALALLGIVARGRQAPRAVAAAVLPCLAIGAAASFGLEVQPRYAFVAAPALLLLAAAGGAWLFSPLAGSWRFPVASAALSAALLPGVVSQETDGDRHDWRSAAEFVAPLLDGETVLLSESHALLGTLLWGLDRRLPPGEGDPPFPFAFEEIPPPDAAMRSVERSGRRVVAVVPANVMENLEALGGGSLLDWARRRAAVVARIGRLRWDYHRNELLVLFAERRRRE